MDKYLITQLEPNEKVIAIGTESTNGNLTKFKEYKAIRGLEAGIFANRPFVTVLGEYGKPFSCHASRFIKPELLEQWKSTYGDT